MPGACDDLGRVTAGVVLADGSRNTAFVNRTLESDFIVSGTVAHRSQHAVTRHDFAGLPDARGEVAANCLTPGKSKEKNEEENWSYSHFFAPVLLVVANLREVVPHQLRFSATQQCSHQRVCPPRDDATVEPERRSASNPERRHGR